MKWSYAGETGPEHWADLDPDWAIAREGRRQSPIDLTGAIPADLPRLRFQYSDSPLEVRNTGNSIQVAYGPGSRLEAEGRSFDLVQFHFHAPSEHRVQGEEYAMELHLVHLASNGEVAVVAVLIRPGSVNRGIETIWEHAPETPGREAAPPGVRIHAERLLPSDRSYYRYNGSLTTPPCSEGVDWFVLRKPIDLSSRQIESYRGLHPDTARPLQRRHGRLVLRTR